MLGALLALVAAFSFSQTALIPALPDLQRALGTSVEGAALAITAFMLGLSVATPIVGRLGDMFGKRRVLIGAMVVFCVGAVLAAVSESLAGLLLGRLAQGIGGGIFPLSYGIIRDQLPRQRVPAAIGLVAATFGAGGAIGPLLSEWILNHADYQAIFWLSAGLVGAGTVCACAFVPETATKGRVSIDWIGALLLCLGLTPMIFAISQGNRWGWWAPQTLAMIGFAVLTLAAWVVVERRQADPIVDMAMMRRQAVLATNLAGFLIGFGLFACLVLVPQLGEAPVGTGPVHAVSTGEPAVSLAALGLFMLIGAPLSAQVGTRFGSRLPLLVGAGLAATSCLSLALVHTEAWALYLAVAALGTAIGFSSAAQPNIILTAVDQSQSGVATGMNTVVRTIGGALGAQVAAAILSAHSAAETGSALERGFVAGFMVAALSASLAFFAARMIPRGRGEQMPPGASCP